MCSLFSDSDFLKGADILAVSSNTCEIMALEYLRDHEYPPYKVINSVIK